MNFNTYVKGSKSIRATERAFEVLYKQQGFRLKATPKGAEGNDASGGSGGDNGKGAAAGKQQGAKK